MQWVSAISSRFSLVGARVTGKSLPEPKRRLAPLLYARSFRAGWGIVLITRA